MIASCPYQITLFEWLFNCIKLREKSSDLFRFILQFSPDLLLVYLHAVYESNVKVRQVVNVCVDQ